MARTIGHVAALMPGIGRGWRVHSETASRPNRHYVHEDGVSAALEAMLCIKSMAPLPDCRLLLKLVMSAKGCLLDTANTCSIRLHCAVR